MLEAIAGLAPRSRLFTRQLLFYPFELDSHFDFGFWICDFGLEECLQIEVNAEYYANPKSEI